MYVMPVLQFKKSKLEGFKFKHSKRDSFNYYENAAFKTLYEMLKGKGPTNAEGLLFADYELDSEIISLKGIGNKTVIIRIKDHVYEKFLSN